MIAPYVAAQPEQDPRARRTSPLGPAREVLCLLVELRLLRLKPLFRRDDVRDSLVEVLQILELALVRVVERLGRILRVVEQFREGYNRMLWMMSARRKAAYLPG
jgi:hypothetical protein